MTKSPAIQLLTHVWKHQGEGQYWSWARLNSAMHAALRLVIIHGFRFDRDDFKLIDKSAEHGGFSFGYWGGVVGHLLGEYFYSLACARNRAYGVNLSACLAFEAWKARRPFILRQPGQKTGRRLAVGSKFNWYGYSPTCTSFSEDARSLVACAYRPTTGRVRRRFKIDHAQIREFHQCIGTSEGAG